MASSTTGCRRPNPLILVRPGTTGLQFSASSDDGPDRCRRRVHARHRPAIPCRRLGHRRFVPARRRVFLQSFDILGVKYAVFGKSLPCCRHFFRGSGAWRSVRYRTGTGDPCTCHPGKILRYRVGWSRGRRRMPRRGVRRPLPFVRRITDVGDIRSNRLLSSCFDVGQFCPGTVYGTGGVPFDACRVPTRHQPGWQTVAPYGPGPVTFDTGGGIGTRTSTQIGSAAAACGSTRRKPRESRIADTTLRIMRTIYPTSTTVHDCTRPVGGAQSLAPVRIQGHGVPGGCQ